MYRTLRYCLNRGLLVLALACPVCAWPAELPRQFVDTDLPDSDTREATVHVAAGDDLQKALDEARPGDVIELEAGAVFPGSFTLPVKSGEDWIIIRSAAVDKGLPAPGNRVTPAHAPYMAKLVSRAGPVVSGAPGAHHYRFVGVEFRPAGDGEAGGLFARMRASLSLNTGLGGEGIYLKNLILLGADETDPADLPHHIIFDRCYLHGDAAAGTRRGIAMNSRHTAVIGSWLADFKEVGADSQAIAGWNGSGPFRIVNNHLEGAGENILFGGGTPAITGMVPADIEIRGNHFTKPLSWKIDHPEYAGAPWSVKNLFELKNAKRVLVDGNLFEYNWPHAQNGFAILFTVRNERGEAPWATVADVHFTNNVLRNTGSGFNILGRDDNGFPSKGTRDIVIRNNLLTGLGGRWGDGTLLQMLDGVENVTVSGNAAFNSGRIIMSEGRAHRGFTFTHNLVMHNTYGITGTGTSPGKSTLARYFPDATVHSNILVGGPAAAYPGDNVFPETAPDPDDAGSVDMTTLCAALAVTERAEIC